jgi:hypothetical protein
MPAKSKAQQRFMGMVHALQKGEIKPSKVSGKVKKAAKSMKKKDADDFASTKHKGLPNKVKKEELKRLITKYGAKKVRETIMAVSPKSDKGYREPNKPNFKYDEGFGGELKGGDKKEFEKARKENAEVLGYELTGTSDIKESATDFWMDMFRPGPIPNQYINQLIKKKGMLPSKPHIKRIYKDNGNPNSTQLAKTFKALQKDKYIKKQGTLWRWEAGFAFRTGKELESVNERWNPNKIKSHTSKAINFLKQAQSFARQGQKGAVWNRLKDAGWELKQVMAFTESINEGKVEPKVKSQLNVLAKRLTDLKRADTQLEKSMWEVVMEYTKIYNMVKDGKYFETAGFKQLPGSLELNHKRFSQKFSKSLDSIIKSTKDSVKRLQLKESVNEATSLGADMLLGGLAQVVRKAGMKPKTAKMMGGGFKVSKRDKVGFKMDVEIRGFNKKKTFKLQFEMERGMLYVIIKNKPVKLGKYTMVAHTAKNLKKVGAALIGDK